MNIHFLPDAETGLPHIWVEHGVTQLEVREVFRNPGEDLPGDPGTRIRIASTDAGRILKIIYKREPRNCVFVITGYDLPRKQLKAYRRRRRGKT